MLYFFLIAYFLFYPIADKHYGSFIEGFFIAGFHGSLAIPNTVISLFDNRLVIAESASTLYVVIWWLSLISTILDDIYRFWKSFWGNPFIEQD